MTFEELKAEAKRQGYNLIKIPPKIQKLKKCPICGRLPKIRYEGNLIYVSCPGMRCLMGPVVNRRAEDNIRFIMTKQEAECEAREAWNEMIENNDEENKR